MTSIDQPAGTPVSPLVSVVVPAYRRPHTVRRMIEALSQQTFPANNFEVLVVVDGAHDPLDQVLRRAATPYELRWFVRPHQGETAQRNFGLGQARAAVVLYLDDDTIPSPELLARHYAHHRKGERIAVFGALHLDPESTEPLVAKASDWTSGHFQRCVARAEPSHLDLPDNNFSIRKQDLAAIGGWDEGLSDGYGGLDDWELGYRLREAGIRFIFDAHATAFHCWAKPLRDELEHCRVYGRAELYYYLKFPERLGDLTVLSYICGYPAQRALLRLARWSPELLVAAIRACAGVAVRGIATVSEPAATVAIKALRHFFICCGLWDCRATLTQIIEQAQRRVSVIRLAAGEGETSSAAVRTRIQKYLAGGFNLVSLNDLFAWKRSLTPLPPKPLVILLASGSSVDSLGAIVDGGRMPTLLLTLDQAGNAAALEARGWEVCRMSDTPYRPSLSAAIDGKLVAYPFSQHETPVLLVRRALGKQVEELRLEIREPGSVAQSNDVERWQRHWSLQGVPYHDQETEEFYTRHGHELRGVFGPGPFGSALEFGCGTGALFPHFGLERCNYRGVDGSAAMLEVFRRHHPTVDLVQAEASSYREAGAVYDLLFSNALIQYFDDTMLDAHLAAARSMMHSESVFVCGTIPWALHRSRSSAQEYIDYRRRSPLRRAAAVLLQRVAANEFGRWFDPEWFVGKAAQHGLSCEIFGSMCYLDRFHARMRLVCR